MGYLHRVLKVDHSIKDHMYRMDALRTELSGDRLGQSAEAELAHSLIEDNISYQAPCCNQPLIMSERTRPENFALPRSEADAPVNMIVPVPRSIIAGSTACAATNPPKQSV